MNMDGGANTESKTQTRTDGTLYESQQFSRFRYEKITVFLKVVQEKIIKEQPQKKLQNAPEQAPEQNPKSRNIERNKKQCCINQTNKQKTLTAPW